jgi:TRAP-type uncharacterized transport system substrate-binding protein
MNMKSLQVKLPFWVRAVLLAGVFCIIAGAGLVAYRFYRQPVTLTLAVGSLDGEAKKVASLIAGHLATSGSPVRLKVVNSGSVLDAAKAFASGQADLAVVREDVGDLSQARTIAMTAHGVVMIVAPPGSPISSIAKLRGHTVGVVGGEINQPVVDALKKEYDLGSANVTFRNIAPADARRAVQAREVAALLMVMPLTDRNLSFVKGLFREDGNSQPVLIPIDSAGAIADDNGAYESFDIPKGTLRGAPPVPDDDVTTLRVGYYLVANRHLNATVAGELAKRVMAARRDLGGEEKSLSGLAAPDLDADAYLTVHPGAAAFFNGTQESFMDRYGNAIYLTPMVLGALASIFAAAWRFLGVRADATAHPVLDVFCVVPERIRNTHDETELRQIEQEVDGILRRQLAQTAGREEGAAEAHALIAAAQRLDNLIHHRRTLLAGQVGKAPVPEV